MVSAAFLAGSFRALKTPEARVSPNEDSWLCSSDRPDSTFSFASSSLDWASCILDSASLRSRLLTPVIFSLFSLTSTVLSTVPITEMLPIPSCRSM